MICSGDRRRLRSLLMTSDPPRPILAQRTLTTPEPLHGAHPVRAVQHPETPMPSPTSRRATRSVVARRPGPEGGGALRASGCVGGECPLGHIDTAGSGSQRRCAHIDVQGPGRHGVAPTGASGGGLEIEVFTIARASGRGPTRTSVPRRITLVRVGRCVGGGLVSDVGLQAWGGPPTTQFELEPARVETRVSPSGDAGCRPVTARPS